MRDTIFISYSRKDKEWLQLFKRSLAVGVYGATLTWSDEDIQASTDWQREIDEKISAAKVALLLVTPHFVESEYIARQELAVILDRQKRNGLKILWVPVRAVSEETLKLVGLHNIQSAWSLDKPLSDLPPAACRKAIDQICDKAMKDLGLPGDSRPPELPPQPLAEPYVTLPRHTAPVLAAPGDAQNHWTFISFSTQDRKAATEILNELERAGVRCWIANRDVPYGRDYQEAIVDALDQADSMVLVFSNDANNSEDIAREVALASERKILILPTRLEDARPAKALRYQLANRQYIDLFDDREQKMKSIVETLYKVKGIKSA